MSNRTGSVIPRGIPFSQIPHQITLDEQVTNAAYRVYGLLMKLANTESRAWPGHRYLEDHLPMTRKTIAAALSNLEDCGWLIVDRSRQGHQYVVVVEQARLDLEWGTNDTGGEITPVPNLPRTGNNSTPAPVENLPHTDNQDRQPVQTTSLATRNVAWDWLTDKHRFNLTASTTAQKRNVGRLARELNAKINDAELNDGTQVRLLDDNEISQVLDDRAQNWPYLFPGASMTADAFVKHFELLGNPPLRRSKQEQVRAETKAAIAELEDAT